jgi:hypothetical protein
MKEDSLIRGTYSEVSGKFSATANMKTLKASRTVMPSVTLSPESGGITNTRSVSVLNIMHGTMTFIMKKSTRRFILSMNVTSGKGSGLYNNKKSNKLSHT